MYACLPVYMVPTFCDLCLLKQKVLLQSKELFLGQKTFFQRQGLLNLENLADLDNIVDSRLLYVPALSLYVPAETKVSELILRKERR